MPRGIPNSKLKDAETQANVTSEVSVDTGALSTAQDQKEDVQVSSTVESVMTESSKPDKISDPVEASVEAPASDGNESDKNIEAQSEGVKGAPDVDIIPETESKLDDEVSDDVAPVSEPPKVSVDGDKAESQKDDVVPDNLYDVGNTLQFAMSTVRVFKNSVTKEYKRLPCPLYVYNSNVVSGRVCVSGQPGGKNIGWVNVSEITSVN